MSVDYAGFRRDFKVYRRSALVWIADVLQDPTLFDAVHWYPERHFVQRSDGSSMRQVSEPWTGDDVWDAWVGQFYSFQSFVF
jgi:hypothetical protein